MDNVIKIQCRDKSFHIPKNELLSFCEEDWFLSIMIGAEYLENDNNTYEIWEDYKSVISIIETLRYQKLIILEGVNIDYFKSLSEKWCLPDWVLKDIDNEKIFRNKIFTKNDKLEYIKNNYIFSCSNCKIGFKMTENTNKSCKRHLYGRDNIQQLFTCCGQAEPLSHCIEGYHIPTKTLKEAYNEIKDLIT